MFGLINAQGIREDHNIGIVNTAEDGTLFMNIVPSIEPLLQEQTL
jgi:transcriptional regulator with AAA-type ATPase domain